MIFRSTFSESIFGNPDHTAASRHTTLRRPLTARLWTIVKGDGPCNNPCDQVRGGFSDGQKMGPGNNRYEIKQVRLHTATSCLRGEQPRPINGSKLTTASEVQLGTRGRQVQLSRNTCGNIVANCHVL